MANIQSSGLPTDGDVQIHLNSQCVVNLESKVLRRLCPGIKSMIASTAMAGLSEQAIHKGVTWEYRLELQLPANATPDSLEPGFLRSVVSNIPH
jgi:hypothetical protein